MFFVEYTSFFHPKLYKNIFKRRIVLKKKERAVGDTLLLSAMAREIKRLDPDIYLITETRLPELFYHNPHIDENRPWHLYSNRNNVRTWYNIRKDQRKHVIYDLLEGLPYQFPQVELKVELYLDEAEKEAARTILGSKPAICIMSSGKGSFSSNREWGASKFQQVTDFFRKDFQVIQLGGLDDQLLAGAVDFRGKPLRETAAVLEQALLFIGQEGGLMHLANSVGTRSVIIFGGYLLPTVTGYRENINFYREVDCAPCYVERKSCPSRKCMELIAPGEIIEAAERILNPLSRSIHKLG
ncbi:MAG: glycosyltransferase family 9 protein [bacterium]